VRSLSQKSPKGGILVLDDTSFPKQANPLWESLVSTVGRWASGPTARLW
jgi:hypothetical protein